MNKTVVIYKSKYGATKKYVDWLKEKLACDVFIVDDFDYQNLVNYDNIIYAGGIYASGFAGRKHIIKHKDLLHNKKVAIFAVGASPFELEAFNQIKEINLKDLPDHIQMFYGRGAYDEAHMTFIDRTMCRTLRKSLAKKDPTTLEPWARALVEAGNEANTWCDPQYLQPLIDYLM